MVDGRLIKVDIDAQRQRAVGWSDWMTCKECGQVVKLTRTMNKCHSNTELSSHEETRCQFNGGRCAIKLATGRVRPNWRTWN